MRAVEQLVMFAPRDPGSNLTSGAICLELAGASQVGWRCPTSWVGAWVGGAADGACAGARIGTTEASGEDAVAL